MYLRDLWPSDAEVAAAVGAVEGEMFRREYADVFSGDEAWRSMPLASGDTYAWDPHSSYVQHPPYFKRIDQPLEPPADILGARILALFGDSITTDHISPAGNIKATSPAGSTCNRWASRPGTSTPTARGAAITK